MTERDHFLLTKRCNLLCRVARIAAWRVRRAGAVSEPNHTADKDRP